ncbi:MAG: fumarate hydratase [Bacillota bacterium]|nr:fumarate hydratase [Bacillota bacterium]
MISQATMAQALDLAVSSGSTDISPDVQSELEKARDREGISSSREGLDQTIKSLLLSRERKVPACPDTGWPLFFFKVGNEAVLEGGILALEQLTREAVARASAAGLLRRTMKHPLTGHDPGDNIGMNMPWFEYKFVPGNDLQITYVAKGGGSDVFGGTQSTMVAFADGLVGIKKFIIDAYIVACRAGAVCPPSILGIGIGGTANVAATLAKEAACLRLIGSHHPEPCFHELEDELAEAINSLGIGVMGAGGQTSVLGVHIEYAYTHIAGIAVAMSTNCFVARRGTCTVSADNHLTMRQDPDWFGGR